MGKTTLFESPRLLVGVNAFEPGQSHALHAHHDMDKAWRQLMRWLVTDVPNRVDLAVQPQADNPNGAVQLQVRVRDPKFQALDN